MANNYPNNVRIFLKPGASLRLPELRRAVCSDMVEPDDVSVFHFADRSHRGVIDFEFNLHRWVPHPERILERHGDRIDSVWVLSASSDWVDRLGVFPYLTTSDDWDEDDDFMWACPFLFDRLRIATVEAWRPPAGMQSRFVQDSPGSWRLDIAGWTYSASPLYYGDWTWKRPGHPRASKIPATRYPLFHHVRPPALRDLLLSFAREDALRPSELTLFHGDLPVSRTLLRGGKVEHYALHGWDNCGHPSYRTYLRRREAGLEAVPLLGRWDPDLALTGFEGYARAKVCVGVEVYGP